MEDVVQSVTHYFKGESRLQLTKILERSGMERGNFEDALAAWEDELLKCEKDTGSELSDDVKSADLMHKTRGQL